MTPPHRLAVMDAVQSGCDNIVVATMPDVGDYELNGVFVRTSNLRAALAGARPPVMGACRVIFADVNPRRAWEDVDHLQREAASLGIPVFDARLSHATVPEVRRMTCRTIFVDWGQGVTKACSTDWSEEDSIEAHPDYRVGHTRRDDWRR